MTDPIEEKTAGKQVVILIHNGDARAYALYHRLAALAALQVIMVTDDPARDRQGIEENPALEKLMDDLRQPDILRLIARDPYDAPAIAALPDIRHDYNARAAYEPRKQDQAMMAKSRDARNNAARVYRGCHYRL